MDPDAPSTWSAGDLDAMFVRLSNEPYVSLYDTKILSSPNTTGGPWVITMENVVSEKEAEHLIELGAVEGYERSADVGELKADGSFDTDVNSGRTSTNAWCQFDCYTNATSAAVIDRLSDITGIVEKNSEYLQLLLYEEVSIIKFTMTTLNLTSQGRYRVFEAQRCLSLTLTVVGIGLDNPVCEC